MSKERPKDLRLKIPAFREAHKVVCKVYHEIDKSAWPRLPQLRAAASAGNARAMDLLVRYERAIAARRATTKKAGA